MSRLNYGAAAAARPAPRFAPKAALRLARCHWRIANIRKDFLHKFTTRFSKDHAEIFVENLNMKRMGQNRRLSRAIQDGQTRRLAPGREAQRPPLLCNSSPPTRTRRKQLLMTLPQAKLSDLAA